MFCFVWTVRADLWSAWRRPLLQVGHLLLIIPEQNLDLNINCPFKALLPFTIWRLVDVREQFNKRQRTKMTHAQAPLSASWQQQLSWSSGGCWTFCLRVLLSVRVHARSRLRGAAAAVRAERRGGSSLLRGADGGCQVSRTGVGPEPEPAGQSRFPSPLVLVLVCMFWFWCRIGAARSSCCSIRVGGLNPSSFLLVLIFSGSSSFLSQNETIRLG